MVNIEKCLREELHPNTEQEDGHRKLPATIHCRSLALGGHPHGGAQVGTGRAFPAVGGRGQKGCPRCWGYETVLSYGRARRSSPVLLQGLPTDLC